MTKTLITDSIAEQNFILDRHRSALLPTLQQAIARATQLQQGVIASFTLPVKHYDTIQAFIGVQRAALGEAFFWEQPSEGNALIGVGTATTIEGDIHALDAAAQWRAVLQDAVVASATSQESDEVYGQGPIFFGGFAFDADTVRTQLWSGFPNGLLLLPRFLFRYSKDITSLTINVLLHSTDDAEECFSTLDTELDHLLKTIRSVVQGELVQEEPALSIEDTLPATTWMQKVAETAAAIRDGHYEKVVLARSVGVTLQGEAAFAIADVMRRLRESYPETYIFALQRGTQFFVGATPERLVQAQNGQIQTMALAGTAPRGATPEEDKRLGTELLESKKNGIEHAVVAARVREALLAHCSMVHVSDTPRLLKLKNVQHLQTPIIGKLLPGRCILDVMGDLHPTPAVGGFPREEALEAIRRIEGLDRGWYAGPLGWIGASGHGEFAVALRSGLVSERAATLFAGCGIVGASEPQSEYTESRLKLQVMLRGLGQHE